MVTKTRKQIKMAVGGLGGYLKELVVGIFILSVMLPVALELFTDIDIATVTGTNGSDEWTTIISAWPYVGVAVVAGIIIYFIFSAFRR